MLSIKTVYESARNIPVVGSYDVIIAGGGIAGVSAALAASRNGAKTLIIEKQCIVGGLATAGLVPIFLPICDGMGNQVSFGIAEELLKLSVKHQKMKPYPVAWLEDGNIEEKIKDRFEARFNSSLVAILLEKLLKEENVEILYDTVIANVTEKYGKITHLIVENKSGRMAYKANTFVDATGDADLFNMSNSATHNYPDKNLLAAWHNVNIDGSERLNMLGISEIPREEKNSVQISNLRFSGLCGQENSEMLQLSHEKMLESYEENIKKYESYYITAVPTMPQIRMTRRIVGEYELDISDDGKEFPDSVGLISNWRKRGPVYEVPFRCLYNSRVKNMISAGRCISTTDEMWDIARVIPCCAVTGQAAGTAAAFFKEFDSIDIRQLQEQLKKDGVVIHTSNIK